MASKALLDIRYVAASNGASAGAGAAIGAIEIGDAFVWGIGIGMVAGPISGALAGVACSL